jgi:hypothetical protein
VDVVANSRKLAIPTSEVTLEPRDAARQETKKAGESFAAGLNANGRVLVVGG